MIRSFRLRLALLSALMSGLVLLASGWTTYWFFRDFRLGKVVQELRENAEREARRVRTVDDWHRIESKIAASLGIRNDGDLILLVEDGRGTVTYRSSHWPELLVWRDLAWPAPGGRSANAPLGDRSIDAPPPGAPRVAEAVARSSAEPYRSGPPPLSKSATWQSDRQTWHLGLATSDQARVAIGVDQQFIASEMRSMRNGLILALPVALSLTGFAAWLFSARAIRPLRRLIDATHRITAEKLDQRIVSPGEDREFAEVISVFNGMLERLERSFHQAQRFSADAAHELKTPLAIIQGQLERSIGRVDAGSQIQAELGSILEEVRRLSIIAGKLLLLAQADAGRLTVLRQRIDLSGALHDLLDDIALLAPRLVVTSEIRPALAVDADPSLFPQILHNLVSNAVKYNIDGGWIRIEAAESGGLLRVAVTNSSPSIPVEVRGRLFDRFFRADPSHSRQISGSGLGLGVAREIARAHGGEIEAAVGEDGTVRFTLVIAAAGQARAVSR